MSTDRRANVRMSQAMLASMPWQLRAKLLLAMLFPGRDRERASTIMAEIARPPPLQTAARANHLVPDY